MNSGPFQEALDSEISPVWRCLRTKPKSEHLAARQLRVLAPGAIEAFCPRIRHRKKTSRGPVWFVEALFPGYVFAQCEWAVWQRAVLATPGVTGQVHFGAYVPEISLDVVSQLRASFSGADEMHTVHTEGLIEVGDVVEVAAGPLRGASGAVARLMPARERVAILLDFLGSTREVEVSLLDVLGLQDARQAAFPG